MTDVNDWPEERRIAEDEAYTHEPTAQELAEQVMVIAMQQFYVLLRNYSDVADWDDSSLADLVYTVEQYLETGKIMRWYMLGYGTSDYFWREARDNMEKRKAGKLYGGGRIAVWRNP